MTDATQTVIDGLADALRDPECPIQFSPLLMEARQTLVRLSKGWQPIETAPKDGSYILLTNDIFVDVGRWSHGSFGGFAGDSDPTHWRPLPDPPSGELTNGKQS